MGRREWACLDVDTPRWVEVPTANSLGRVAVSSLVVDAGRVISVAVTKAHGRARLTLSLKNFIGVTPLARHGWHGGGNRDRVALHSNDDSLRGFTQLDLDIVVWAARHHGEGLEPAGRDPGPPIQQTPLSRAWKLTASAGGMQRRRGIAPLISVKGAHEMLALSIVAASVLLAQGPSPYDTLQAALRDGRLSWQLTEPEEAEALLGAHASEATLVDGGMDLLKRAYADGVAVYFGKERGAQAPFVLIGIERGTERLRAPRGERLVLRSATDLARLRPFSGLQGVDARKADFRGELARLEQLPFDTGTLWPPSERLPESFDPAALLEAGMNPGLGLRALHAEGIDGRGVHIAVIDQPLVKDHVETQGRLHMLAELDVTGAPPQMHGPAVTSIAAGKRCGVAPAAALHFVSMPMWKAQQDLGLYLQALEQVLDLNRRGPHRIRAVSISYGGFREAPQAEAWQALLDRAEAEGVLVITCDLEASRLEYGLLEPLPGGDRERPEGFVKGEYGGGLLVPGHGRSYAGPEGPTAYAYGPRGGLSWGAPYLAGLTALGFQVNPALTPARVRAYLMRSATTMPYGQVVNPAAFVKLCREDPDARAEPSAAGPRCPPACATHRQGAPGDRRGPKPWGPRAGSPMAHP